MSPYNGFNHAMKNWIHGNNRGMKEIAHKFNGLFPGHQGNGRFSISDTRMKAAANLWDSVVGKKGFWGFAARIYREYLSGILENPIALMAVGTIVACIFTCVPFFAYAAGVAGISTAVAFSEAVFIGGLHFIFAGWGAGYLLSGMSRTTLANLNFDKHQANAGGYLGASIATVTVAGVFGYAAWKYTISPSLQNTFLGNLSVEGHSGVTMFGSLEPLSWGLATIDLLSGDYLSAAYGFTTAYYGIPIPFGGLKWLYRSVMGGYNARL